MLLAVNEGRLDALDLPAIDKFKAQLGDFLTSRCPHLNARIDASGDLTEEDRAALLSAIDELAASLTPEQEAAG